MDGTAASAAIPVTIPEFQIGIHKQKRGKTVLKYYHDQEEIIVAEKNTERRHLINVIKFEGEDDALVWKLSLIHI